MHPSEAWGVIDERKLEAKGEAALCAILTVDVAAEGTKPAYMY